MLLLLSTQLTEALASANTTTQDDAGVSSLKCQLIAAEEQNRALQEELTRTRAQLDNCKLTTAPDNSPKNHQERVTVGESCVMADDGSFVIVDYKVVSPNEVPQHCPPCASPQQALHGQPSRMFDSEEFDAFSEDSSSDHGGSANTSPPKQGQSQH